MFRKGVMHWKGKTQESVAKAIREVRKIVGCVIII